MDTVPDVSTNQLVLYVVLAATIVGIISGAWPKLLKMFGQGGEAVLERMERQRTTAKAIDDADIQELNRGMENLQNLLREERKLLRDERRSNDAQRALISNLYIYILAAQRDPNNLQKPVPDPSDYLVVDEQRDTDNENFRS